MESFVSPTQVHPGLEFVGKPGSYHVCHGPAGLPEWILVLLPSSREQLAYCARL